MVGETAPEAVGGLWLAVGAIGGIIFYGRFYVQWIASEIKRKSVMPVAFWYMSSVGSVMLLTFAVATQSPVGALGQCFNIITYSRNLVHIWREKGTLTKKFNFWLHVVVFSIALVAFGFVIKIWLREYEATSKASPGEAATTWLWLGIGLAGQALFAGRFLIQWIMTEIKRKSVIPTIFWHLSIVAATLQVASFAQRQEWVFAAGGAATILIYARNLLFIYRGDKENLVK